MTTDIQPDYNTVDAWHAEIAKLVDGGLVLQTFVWDEKTRTVSFTLTIEGGGHVAVTPLQTGGGNMSSAFTTMLIAIHGAGDSLYTTSLPSTFAALPFPRATCRDIRKGLAALRQAITHRTNPRAT